MEFKIKYAQPKDIMETYARLTTLCRNKYDEMWNCTLFGNEIDELYKDRGGETTASLKDLEENEGVTITYSNVHSEMIERIIFHKKK